MATRRLDAPRGRARTARPTVTKKKPENGYPIPIRPANRWSGAEFRRWRERIGLGTEQAAVVLGVHRTTVFRIEAQLEAIEWTLELACRAIEAVREMREHAPGRWPLALAQLERWARDARII